MVVSTNPAADKEEFDQLLNMTIRALETEVQQSAQKFASLAGRNFEPYLKDMMSELAVDTAFENSIELIGGQKFPDIIAQKYYGIEVKTTSQNHWKTTGNSVFEGTRVDSVERIYMMFAKLTDPVEFRCRPYEDVLSEIVVTHSPRYLIDMNLEEGQTIFDKINMPYDVLRKEKNPIKPIVNYYKTKLRPGEELWWMDNEDHSKSSNIVIRIWNNLNQGEREEIKVKAMAYFPEIFGNKQDKFSRLAVWLITREGIVCPNVRDILTAGGKSDYTIKDVVYKNVPRVFVTLFHTVREVASLLIENSKDELSEYWGKKTSEESVVFDWIELVGKEAEKISSAKHLNIKKMLKELIL